ncbi:erythromycin esterase family protein [Geothrix campi]|uniref:erythromycin esterase family protein n=1 Tax=Geothrix campi TaxID=2966450 RepID=UPI002148833D|nr:erythromycin esterase family protein [Geothrix sp. SG10]
MRKHFHFKAPHAVCFLVFGLPLMAQAPPARANPISPSIRVEGRVLDLDGHPVPAAMVALVPANPADARIQVVDASGHFMLEGSPGTKWGLTVTASGFLPHFSNLDIEPGKTDPAVEVKLRPGGFPVRGTVLAAKGHSLEGMRLGFSRFSQEEGDVFFAEVKQQRFDLNLAPGAYTIDATAKDQSFIGGRFDLKGEKTDIRVMLKAEPVPAGAEVLAWIKTNALPLRTVLPGQGFEDLRPLEAIVGNARVVGLGEATHGTKEFFQLKHRILEFLVEKEGFTLFGLEAGMPEASLLDDFVLTGKGDPAEALAMTHPVWNVEEMLALIRWMRAYNANPAHPKKLRFYGFDMQERKRTYACVKVWLDEEDPGEAVRLASLNDRMSALLGAPQSSSSTERLKAWKDLAQEVEALTQRQEKRMAVSISAGLSEVARCQFQNIRLLAQFAAVRGDADRGLRDRFMATNVAWRLAQDPGAKMVLWAHNGHIAYRPGVKIGAETMGWYLRRSMGQAYRNFGFAFRDGAFRAWDAGPERKGAMTFTVAPQAKGTLDAALGSTNLPILALDLGRLPGQGPIREWFEAPQGTWDVGAEFIPASADRFLQKEPITAYYDALLFVSRTLAATPCQKP